MSENRPSEGQTQPKKKVKETGKLLLLIVIVVTFIVWIIPQFGSIQPRSDVNAKQELRYLLSACKAYWAKEGPGKECNVDIVSGTPYEYIPDPKVSIKGSGTEKTFTATAQHADSTIVFTIDTGGMGIFTK